MKKINKNVNGITLVSLIITIIVMIILSSIAIYSGKEVINSSKFTKFTTELKIMQTQVNQLYENKSEDNEILNLGKELGEAQAQADVVFTINASGITDQTGYRYFDKTTIKNLNIEGIEGEFFINIEKRSVVSYKGFKYEGVTYYTLEQLPGGLYNVGYENKNTGEPTFELTGEYESGKSKWKIKISNIQYNSYIDKWKVNYKLEGQSDWNTSKDYSFTVKEKGKYIVQIVNGMVKSEEKHIIIGQAPILPAKYQQVEYIEGTGTGTQYIDTGYTLTSNSKVEIKFEMTAKEDMCIFGSRTSATENNFEIFYGVENNKGKIAVDFYNWTKNRFEAEKSENELITVTQSKEKAAVNGAEKKILYDDYFETPASAYIFYISNDQPFPDCYAKMKLFSCKIWETIDGKDVLQREFIPCYSEEDKDVGLYDIVEGAFYGNAIKDNNFTKGTDVNYVEGDNEKEQNSLKDGYKQVKYIEGTGTQYIDTEYKLTSNSKVEIKFEMTEKDNMCIFGSRTSAEKNNFGIFYDMENDKGKITVDFYDCYKNRFEAEKSENELITVTQSKEKATVNERGDSNIPYDFETPESAYIFYISSNQPYQYPDYDYAKIKLYACKIWEGDVLVRNFIPCYKEDTAEIGLYDTVEGKFYTNRGTGTFEIEEYVNSLPYEYQQVEYIEGTGTQYIDTEYTLTSNSKVEIKFEMTAKEDMCIFGSRTSAAANNFSMFCASGYDGLAVDFYDYNINRLIVKQSENELITVTQSKEKATVNKIGNSNESYDFETPASAYIFYISNNQPYPYPAYNYAKIKLYACKIWEGDVLVRKFIPCYKKDTGEIGLYDTVDDKFYINQGTDKFLKGNAVIKLPSEYQEVEYIKSNGQQYIDTGITPDINTGFYLDIKILDPIDTNGKRLFGTAYRNSGTWGGMFIATYSSTNGGQMHYIESGKLYNPRLESNNRMQISLRNGHYTTSTGADIKFDTSTLNMDTPGPIYILNVNSDVPATTYSSAYLYQALLYDGDVLVRDYIPCYKKDTGEIGLYDTVEDKFYTNQGTGTFEKGADVN